MRLTEASISRNTSQAAFISNSSSVDSMSPSSDIRLSDKIYSYIIDKISKGTFTPGARISERKLAKELGVSHIPVREAMEKMIHDQWVQRIPNQGIVVNKINSSEVRRELYQVRGALELCAVQQIISNLNDDKLSALDKAAHNFDIFDNCEIKSYPLNTSLEEDNVHQNYDILFHELLLKLSDNKRLWQIGRTLVLQTICYFIIPPNSTLLQLYLQSDNSYPQVSHHIIVDAIRHQNINEAEKAIRGHLDFAYHSSRFLRRTLKLE